MSDPDPLCSRFRVAESRISGLALCSFHCLLKLTVAVDDINSSLPIIRNVP